MGKDGIVRATLDGDVSNADMENLLRDFAPFLEAASEAEPVHMILDATLSGKVSSGARKLISDLNSDLRVGTIAIIGAKRYIRVLVSFILRATGRDNFRFSDSEEEAVVWLREGATK
jgi:hypothetical protein